jgi:hypothetical protein
MLSLISRRVMRDMRARSFARVYVWACGRVSARTRASVGCRCGDTKGKGVAAAASVTAVRIMVRLFMVRLFLSGVHRRCRCRCRRTRLGLHRLWRATYQALSSRVGAWAQTPFRPDRGAGTRGP